MSNKAGSGRYQNGAARRKCKARHIAAEGPIPICRLVVLRAGEVIEYRIALRLRSKVPIPMERIIVED